MEQVPALFVFMGNFHSRASSSARSASGVSGADVEYTAVRDGFSALAALVDQYPRIKVRHGKEQAGCWLGARGASSSISSRKGRLCRFRVWVGIGEDRRMQHPPAWALGPGSP